MKVKSSEYLANVKPLLVCLRDELLQHFPYVSILATDAVSKSYQVRKSSTLIESDDTLGERGFVVKVYDKSSYAEYSFNELTQDGISDVVRCICEELIPLSENMPAQVQKSIYAMISDEEAKFSNSTEYEIDPESYDEEVLVEQLTQMSEQGRNYSEQILDYMVNVTYQRYSKMFLSKNRDMEQNVLWTTGVCYAMASKGEEIKNSYRTFSNLGGLELLEKMQESVDEVAKVTIALLDSEPMIPGEYECICDPGVTGMIVHEAFGHGVEMDMFVKKRALAEQFVGKQVASELVTMHDGAAAAKQVASYFFDDEGVLAQDTMIIDHGILKTGICDAQSAMYLGVAPTGNGRRESYQRKAYTRMTNTYFEGGKDNIDDMISSISYGFLLQQAQSGMEDPKNWGIQCMVNIAREIKDGKLTGKIYSPVVLTGYVPDLLKSISMVSEEVKLGAGTCGKGYKEWVKVSDGGSYIKAKIRLG